MIHANCDYIPADMSPSSVKYSFFLGGCGDRSQCDRAKIIHSVLNLYLLDKFSYVAHIKTRKFCWVYTCS